MKKLFLIFTLVLITVGLSGCDLISPSQVEEISEQYCRDNPTSEICQGDVVGDLANDIILNVFNTILDEYNDESNETFCDDYFSVTNTELLDSCRASREGLIPENYIGYTVAEDGVKKKTTLSTQDVYEITVVSEDLLTEIVFTIGLVNVEGIMYINAWSYEVITNQHQDLDVPLEEAQAFFKQFITEYLDPNISSYDICNQYFGDRVTECIEERDASFGIGFDVSMEDMISEGDGVFEVKLTFTDTETYEPRIEFNLLTFKYDENGDIVMTFLHDEHSEEWLKANQALAVIEKFFEDYTDDTITNPLFNDLYFSNTMHEDFFGERNKAIEKGYVFSVVSVEDPTEEPFEFLILTMSRTYNDETETNDIKLRIRDLGSGRYYFDILFDEHQGIDPSDHRVYF